MQMTRLFLISALFVFAISLSFLDEVYVVYVFNMLLAREMQSRKIHVMRM